MEAGSPPCSPQMPSLRAGLVLRPRSVAMRWPFSVQRYERVVGERRPAAVVAGEFGLDHRDFALHDLAAALP